MSKSIWKMMMGAAVGLAALMPLSARAEMTNLDVDSIVGIVCPFGMITLVVALAGYFAYRRNKMAHETIRAMIDKGVPMTPDLIAELKSHRPFGSRTYGSRSGRLFPGLICIGVGTALLITGNTDTRGGWIVLFVGLAFLTAWVVDRKNSANTQPPQQ